MKKYRKILVFLMAIILGVVFGIQFYPYIGYVKWMGDLFLLILSVLLIPIILFSIIVAFVKTKRDLLVRIGVKTISFYAVTMLLAVLTGVLFSSALHSGAGLKNLTSAEKELKSNSFSDKNNHFKIQKNSVWNNPIKEELVLKDSTDDEIQAQSNPGAPDTPAQSNLVKQETQAQSKPAKKNVFEKTKDVFTKVNKASIVYIFVIAFLIGLLINIVPSSRSQTLRSFFQKCFDGIMRVLSWIVSYVAPFGVFGIIASKCAKSNGNTEQLVQSISSTSMFVVTNFVGMGFHCFIFLSLLIFFFARINPIHHMINMFPSVLTAFSTASSNSAMPKSLECLKTNSGISPQTADFVMPLGSIFNMNGTVLYVCITVISFYQMNGVSLSISDYFMIIGSTMVYTAGFGIMPMAGFCITEIVLNVDLMKEMSFLLIIDPILEMTRAALNIYGNSCCAVCIARLQGERLNA